jgi:DNA-binding CsgD family transcriptional regulator
VRGPSESGPNGGARDEGFPKLTRRQAQILDLAASGLSDKEIARRLRVSHRTVRTHFEKLFKDSGFRNRSQAVGSWTARPEAGHRRPADECPYPKPFPPGFSECPAFQATQMVALDISSRPLGSILTCRHLESRLMPKADFRWYGACVIGDAEARRRWSNQLGADRLGEINALRQEISTLSAPYVQRLWQLKTAEVHDPALASTFQQQIESTVDEFMAQMRQVLRQREAVLDQLHLPLEACIRLVRLAIDRFVDRGVSEAQWEVPDEILALFPGDVRAYFRPQEVAPAPAQAPPQRAS